MANSKEKKEIFAENLKKFLIEKQISQYKLIKDLNLKKTTVNYWCKGKSFPRYEALQTVADYFGVPISALTEEQPDDPGDISPKTEKHYFDNEETRQLAEEYHNNHELKLLFDAARTAKPEDIRVVYETLLALKKREQHIDDE